MKNELEKIMTSGKTTSEILKELRSHNLKKQLKRIRQAVNMIELFESEEEKSK